MCRTEWHVRHQVEHVLVSRHQFARQVPLHGDDRLGYAVSLMGPPASHAGGEARSDLAQLASSSLSAGSGSCS